MMNPLGLDTAHRLIDLNNQIIRVSKKIEYLRDTRMARERFQTSVRRLACVAGLPFQLIQDFMIAGHLFAEATRYATNGREWRWQKLTPPQLAMAETKYRQLARATHKYRHLRKGVERGLAISNAKEAFNRIMRSSGEDRRAGLDAIMASIIVGAWTSFEVLAEDLWVAALNARPRLGLIALDAEIKESDKPKVKEQKRDVTMSLPLWMVIDPKFKIQKRMGDLLRNYRRNFAARGDPLKSYRKVFPEDRQKLESIFEGRQLRWTEGTRNVIVHNGGLADKDFASDVHDHPKLKKVREGDPVPITGAITYDLCMAAINSGTRLLDFVNGWLKNHAA